MVGSPITGVLETAVYVDDLDAARRFYGAVLGLSEIMAQDGRHVFFRCGSTVLLVFRAEATREPPAPDALPVPPHGTVGAGHVCFAVPEAALAAMVHRLTGAGVDIESDFCWPWGPRSVYVRDPAGNSVEFASPKLWEMPE
ncbi:Glyoxalase/Bleomycin resistance protein/Dioxygenase superfamily protein [Gemmobacter megaterium]|uniref:Glyoxalase/Bleomycin resistance protein/Dioxygenase superfamily protein n=1 Tax=Gemmobacter megaterium TaxID=1086013 RepID=A0A1N7QDB6_9RHOB|nr:VOC family protein [Gemmobacter megaterium]GGE25218.1 bleomycin resistance protein [Gemmobacter megaterium]SIT20786.1 Glyoxalase/Bleomycin resistance protein/Dioxygenase superfamily protein [Gemmobacter megaterium]